MATSVGPRDDDVTPVTGDIMVGHHPICGGHEGAGVVTAVGPNAPDSEVGSRA